MPGPLEKPMKPRKGFQKTSFEEERRKIKKEAEKVYSAEKTLSLLPEPADIPFHFR